MERFDYSKEDVVNALTESGVEKNDNIFIHSNIGFFGKLKNCKEAGQYCLEIKDAIFSVIGSNGTLIVPTFSYSFCNNEKFDIKKTPSVCGLFSEFLRKLPDSERSGDANFSIAAIGKKKYYFTENCTPHSFGENSFWERFLEKNGKFCNFNFDSASTFFHYVEKLLHVPYRYDKGFEGISIENGLEEEKIFYHFVYDLNKPNNGPFFERFDKVAKESGLAKTCNLGRGQIVCISAKDTLEIIKKEIKKCSNFLIKGDTIQT